MSQAIATWMPAPISPSQSASLSNGITGVNNHPLLRAHLKIRRNTQIFYCLASKLSTRCHPWQLRRRHGRESANSHQSLRRIDGLDVKQTRLAKCSRLRIYRQFSCSLLLQFRPVECAEVPEALKLGRLIDLKTPPIAFIVSVFRVPAIIESDGDSEQKEPQAPDWWAILAVVKVVAHDWQPQTRHVNAQLVLAAREGPQVDRRDPLVPRAAQGDLWLNEREHSM